MKHRFDLQGAFPIDPVVMLPDVDCNSNCRDRSRDRSCFLRSKQLLQPQIDRWIKSFNR